ncbi:MAG: DUF4105 domain-containing protein [Chitinophagales bacterium]|nr:DUF4105 domain-containing protein [Chitinophagales bacterium]MDW8419971.1 DUF4105 domain-containing protein [Chitinophagales bacterium]
MSDSSVVSLLTVSPGEPLYAAFGHTGIRVRDDSLGLDVVFNYGTFDDTQEGFYINFVKGKMLYSVTVEDFNNFLWQYRDYEKRRVIEQVLSFSHKDRQEIFNFLFENVQPENSKYYYDFFWDNCATRPRDVIEKVLGKRLVYNDSALPSGYTMRQMLHLYVRNRPWVAFGFDLILGLPCEVPATPRNQTFLPERLSVMFDHAHLDGRPLVSQKNVLVNLPELDLKPGLLTPLNCAVFFLIITLVITLYEIWRNVHLRWLDVSLFMIYGLLGVFFLCMWAFTTHYSVPKNLNVLWLLPTHTIAAVLMAGRHFNVVLGAYMILTAVISVLILIFWKFIPQPFHVAVIPLLLIIAMRALSVYRFCKSKQ